MFANKRAEMWGSMREWLKGGVIPPTPELIADLEGVEYGYVIKNGVDAIQLEKKEDMKKRGLASPRFRRRAGVDLRLSDLGRMFRNDGRATDRWRWSTIRIANRTRIAFRCTLTTSIRLNLHGCQSPDHSPTAN